MSMTDFTDSSVTSFGDAELAAAGLRKLADVVEATAGSVPTGELYLGVSLQIASHSTMPEDQRIIVTDAISNALFGRPAGPEVIAGKHYHNASAWASKDLPGVHFRTGTHVTSPEEKERAALLAQVEELRRQRDELTTQLPAVAGEAVSDRTRQEWAAVNPGTLQAPAGDPAASRLPAIAGDTLPGGDVPTDAAAE